MSSLPLAVAVIGATGLISYLGRQGRATRHNSAPPVCPTDRTVHILDSVLDAVGNTPMIRLNRIPKEEGVACEIVVKCEFLNPGGSVKDRIGRQMVLDAELAKRIQPGDSLVEPTSGNTGIGLSMAAAVRGYRMIIVLPEKMSKEKVMTLKALGSEIHRTPTSALKDDYDSHISLSKRIVEAEPKHTHMLDQYGNPSNPSTHEEGTGVEIWKQCGGKVDMIVIAAGTGGTITGVARTLKRFNPSVIVVGVDPVGSILSGDQYPLGNYDVEGIGYDFVPDVFDRSVVDHWERTEDKESFAMARRLIRSEGLLVGGSCGAAMAGAIRAVKALNIGSGKRVVVLLPDSIRNYLSKFVDDDWMRERRLMQ